MESINGYLAEDYYNYEICLGRKVEFSGEASMPVKRKFFTAFSISEKKGKKFDKEGVVGSLYKINGVDKVFEEIPGAVVTYPAFSEDFTPSHLDTSVATLEEITLIQAGGMFYMKSQEDGEVAKFKLLVML